MIKDGLENHYKQLFLNAHGTLAHLPPEDFLQVAARIAGYLRKKGQVVEELVNESLYLKVRPSDIGAEIRSNGVLRIWLQFNIHSNYWVRDSWTGRFERFFSDFFEYKEIHIRNSEELSNFQPEQALDALLATSERFRGRHPEIKEILDRFERDLDNLYEGCRAKLARVLL